MAPVDGVMGTVRHAKRGPKQIIYDNDELEELEARAWIVIKEPRPVLTEQGHYWLKRFLKTKGSKNPDTRSMTPSGKPYLIEVAGERW